MKNINLEYFIAKRITFSAENKTGISNSVLKIAISAVAVGMTVMIITISIITGFKNEIYRKIIGFRSHISIKNRDMNITFETMPIAKKQDFYPNIVKEKGIKHIQVYATKPGIIKTKNEIQGIVLKGVDTDFDWSFFEESLVAGELFIVKENQKSNKIIISKRFSDLLEIEINDKLTVYFVQNPPRIRIFTVSGIFSTGMEELDKTFAICDIKHIQSLNNWNKKSKELVSGFEIFIDDFDELDKISKNLKDSLSGMLNENGTMLEVSNFKQQYPAIINWLSLSDLNVKVILALMIIVAMLNMISGLLIIILERTNMIGILKALGTENFKIQKIFIYSGIHLIGKGLIWGNIIGVSILLIQKYFGIIPLDPKIYYVSTVPVNLNIIYLFLLNFGTLIITGLSLLFPVMLISKINPANAIKFN